LETIKAEGFPDEREPFGEGFVKAEMWIEAIHTGLSKQKPPAK